MSRNLLQAWQDARSRLEAAGVPGPVIDARVTPQAASTRTRADIVGDPHREISVAQVERLDAYLERRIRREPVSHILGRKGFWNIMLGVTADVLTPRPETEVIVDHALRLFPEGRPFRILDLGVGSGAILLAILAERPAARGLGIDVSEEALAVARDNAARLGLADRIALLRGDWSGGLAGSEFDLVVSNPPYIASPVIETLDPEVRDYEPRIALDGGPDGLEAYRQLAPEILRMLRPGGRFLVEIGYDQRAAAESLFRAAGAMEVETLQDLSTHDRVVTGMKNPLETND